MESSIEQAEQYLHQMTSQKDVLTEKINDEILLVHKKHAQELQKATSKLAQARIAYHDAIARQVGHNKTWFADQEIRNKVSSCVDVEDSNMLVDDDGVALFPVLDAMFTMLPQGNTYNIVAHGYGLLPSIDVMIDRTTDHELLAVIAHVMEQYLVVMDHSEGEGFFDVYSDVGEYLDTISIDRGRWHRSMGTDNDGEEHLLSVLVAVHRDLQNGI